MTTTELIALLQQIEKGASGRSREISIAVKAKNGVVLKDNESLFLGNAKIKINGTGDGVAGAEVNLIIETDA
jgi:hypothetical protein